MADGLMRVSVGLEPLKITLARARAELQPALKEAFLAVVREARDRVAELTPVDSGETAKRWRVQGVQAGAKSGLTGIANFLAVVDHPWNNPGAAKWHPTRQLPLHGPKYDILAALEYGTGPHKIPPRPAGTAGARRGTMAPGYLRFKTRDGTWVTTKKPVDHQGTKAYAMMRTAAPEAQAKLIRRWQIVAAVIAGQINGG